MKTKIDYISDPAWVLKAISYFCLNYRLAGRSLIKRREKAMKVHRMGLLIMGGGVYMWSKLPDTPFWRSLAYMAGLPIVGADGSLLDCQPWTLDEIIMIDQAA